MLTLTRPILAVRACGHFDWLIHYEESLLHNSVVMEAFQYSQYCQSWLSLDAHPIQVASLFALTRFLGESNSSFTFKSASRLYICYIFKIIVWYISSDLVTYFFTVIFGLILSILSYLLDNEVLLFINYSFLTLHPNLFHN